MRHLRRFVTRLMMSLSGRRDDERLRDELEVHLELLTADHVRAGSSPADARCDATPRPE